MLSNRYSFTGFLHNVLWRSKPTYFLLPGKEIDAQLFNILILGWPFQNVKMDLK